MSTEALERPPTALRRLTAGVVSDTAEVLKAAAVLLEPDDATQRRAFGQLMPYLYVLRNKGCSWTQLTQLLNQCGFRLQMSTVRCYYSEMLAARMDACQARMNEQIEIMKEVRAETQGVEIASINDRVQAVLARARAASKAKVDEVFGAVTSALPSRPVPQPTVADPQEAPVTARKELGQAPVLPPAPKKVTTPSRNASVQSASISQAAGNGSASIPTARAASPLHKCRPLQSGFPELPKREGVPDAVYRPGNLEHPAIPGLQLTLAQRRYSASLEYTDAEGEIHTETADQKRFRVKWQKPIPMTETRTGGDFTKMDPNIFAKRSS